MPDSLSYHEIQLLRNDVNINLLKKGYVKEIVYGYALIFQIGQDDLRV